MPGNVQAGRSVEYVGGAGGDDADNTVAPTTGQKIGIWIVGVWFLVEAVGGLVGFFLLAGRVVPVSADKLDFINSLPQPLFFAGFVELFCNLSGGVFLLMRRRVALPFLLGGAAAKLVGNVFAPAPTSLTAGGAPYYTVALVGEWVLLAAALAYVSALWRRRILAP